MAARLGAKPETIGATAAIEVDDGFRSATATACRRRPRPRRLELVARREGILLDPVYTAKAMAGLIARHPRAASSRRTQTVLFWHTGGSAFTWTIRLRY